MSFTYNRLNKDDVALLLVDHQAGLLSLVRDFSPDDFKNNVLALADIARFFEIPTILTTSFEDGPNGPMVPELKEAFPDAPYFARPGQINAWDNADFVEAIKKTGRKKIVMSEAIKVPGYGRLDFREIQKEELIGVWEDIVSKTGLEIQVGETVGDVQRCSDGSFVVTGSLGSYQADRVVLAIGRRGVPAAAAAFSSRSQQAMTALRGSLPSASSSMHS